MKLTHDDIVRLDAVKNHPGRNVSESFAEINGIVGEGGVAMRFNNTLIVFRQTDDYSVEFHTYNADSADQLVQNVIYFLEKVEEIGCSRAWTTYKNPRITELFKRVPWHVDVAPYKGDWTIAEVRLNELG